MAGLQDPQRQPDQRREGKDRGVETSTRSLGYRVTIISMRARLLDAHDNLRSGGAKALVDAITYSLGFPNDRYPGLYWEYYQLIGKPHGTIVVINRL